MKNRGRMKRFRKIVRGLGDEDFNADRFRAMFLKAFILLKKSEGITQRLSDKEHQQLREVFVRTLRMKGVKIKEGLLDTGNSKEEKFKRPKSFSSIVTPAMLRGAYGVQLRHDKVLKYDT